MTEFPYAEQHLKAGAVEMFKPVLNWLDQGAPHVSLNGHEKIGFNMEYFRSNDPFTVEDYQSEGCGTACCIAGAIYTMNSATMSHSQTEDIGPSEMTHKVGQALGMSAQHISELFFADYGEFDEKTIHLGTITASMAAATTRRFLKTGIVTWDESE